MSAFEGANHRDWLTARAAPQHTGLLRSVARVASRLPPQRPRLWTAQFLFSLFGTASFFACFFYLTTTLPREMTDLGFSLLEVGLVVGGYAAIPVFLRPFVGRWSDGGHRIRQMRFALIAFAASFVLMIFTDNLWALFALRCVQGVGMAAYPTSAGSLVAEIVPPVRRGEGLGFFGLSTSFSQTLAPLGGAGIAVVAGFEGVLILGAATALLSLVITIFQREPPAHAGGHPPVSIKTLIPARAVFPMLVFLSVTLGFSVAAAFLEPLADQPHRNLGTVALFFMFSGAGAMIARPLAGRASDRVGRVPVIIPGLIATFAGMALVAMSETAPMLWLAGILTGIGMGGAHTGLLALAVDRVSDTQRGGATATFQLAWDVGGFASFLIAVVGAFFSVEMIFWVAALGALVALAALLLGHVMGWTRTGAPALEPMAAGATAGGG
ncbi:MAG: MFS transporter [Chloroflexi bacterium]|nr:MFS transporter [Chloroflexota bacterium]MYF81445.1 MFS transporter [Chloroflexota bacterium]MYI05260.1 MFS transporter [Chloroflexota bacterium]